MGRAAAFAWERQPGESSRAFEAFDRYRSLGPARSLRETAQSLPKNGKTIAEWSATWDWVERVTAWDDHVADQARKAELSAELARRKKATELCHRAGLQLLTVALRAIAREEQTVDANGRIVVRHLGDEKANAAPLSSIANALVAGARLVGQAADSPMPSEDRVDLSRVQLERLSAFVSELSPGDRDDVMRAFPLLADVADVAAEEAN